MTTTDNRPPNNGIKLEPLKLVKGDQPPRPVLDTSEPILPTVLRDRSAFLATVKMWAKRNAYRSGKWTLNFPAIVCLLVLYSPRGLGRLVGRLGRWVYDQDSANLRHEHAGNRETGEYARAHAVRKANLHARGLVFATCAVLLVGPVLAWTFPHALSGIVGLAVFAWTVKLIPGNSPWEFVAAAGLGVATWWFLPFALVELPRPPVWALWTLLVVVVFVLGWLGRPQGKALVAAGKFSEPSALVKPTADMVVDALCRIGVPGMTLNAADRVRDEIRVIAPGVATSAHGYTIEMELPPGITAEMVVAKRAALAGALRRDLACVWPGGNPNRHPGYLRIFLSHRPMNTGKQPPWPLAEGHPVDIFNALPLFTDEENRWVNLTLAGTHAAVGGASGFGKSVWLRQLALALAFDPRVRLVVFDGKRSGDLECVHRLAHGFYEGAEPEDVEVQLNALRGLVKERERRAKFLSQLPAGERSPKVTTALATKYEGLRPIVLLADEVQEYTEYGIKGNKEDMKLREEFAALLTKLSRVGRAAGIILVFCSQKPDANVLPSAIMGNCGIRVAFKVSEQTHNDQILGTSARKNGVDSTMFTSRDKGMAWLRGGDDVDAQVVRSWSKLAEDVELADELGDRAYELRKARGMLTGEAAGETTLDELQVDLLDDCRDVMDNPAVPRMHLAAIVERLQLLRPALYGTWDAAGLGTALRGRGVVVTDQMKVDGRNSSGVRRDALEVHDEDGKVVPIGR